MVLIKEQLQLIAENPLAGKATNFSDTREAAMGNFSIYYKLKGTEIIITAFWDNRQSPEKLWEMVLA